MPAGNLGRLILCLLVFWTLAACRAQSGDEITPAPSTPTAPEALAARQASLTGEAPGPAPYPDPPTRTPDVAPRTPLPTPTITPTRTPRPTAFPTSTPTEIPPDYFLPIHSVELFEPFELPLDALWTTDGREITAHSPSVASFPLAPDDWGFKEGNTRSFQVTADGSKIAYQAWVSDGSNPSLAGDLILIDDLAAGVRHIYRFPRVDGDGYYIPDLHLSPDETSLLFVVTRGLGWTWMTIDLQTASIQPIPLNLKPLADPRLSELDGQQPGPQPAHASFASLFPTAWTPAGIFAQKVLVGTDAPPTGFYVANPDTGEVTLDLSETGVTHRITQDGTQIAFSTLSVSPFEVTAGNPYFSEIFLYDRSSGQTTSLVRIEDRPSYLQTWTPDENTLSYIVISPFEWKTESLGLIEITSGEHHTIELTGVPGLDPVFASVHTLDETRFLVNTYSGETRQTNLYTVPISDFSLENLVLAQSIPDRRTVLLAPKTWPD